jgi:hypothetical protein
MTLRLLNNLGYNHGPACVGLLVAEADPLCSQNLPP